MPHVAPTVSRATAGHDEAEELEFHSLLPPAICPEAHRPPPSLSSSFRPVIFITDQLFKMQIMSGCLV